MYKFRKEGFEMERVYTARGEEVSVFRIFVKSRTHDVDKDSYGFAIDIECQDVFLTDYLKEEVEKLSALILSYAPEIQVYRHIKDREPIMEFKASQFLSGSYKINVFTSFQECLAKIQSYNDSINCISKSIIERICYLFGAYSLDNY
jgi:hypothetical protein